MREQTEWYLAELKPGWYHTTVKFNTPRIRIFNGEYLMTDNKAMAKRYHRKPPMGTPVKVRATYEVIE